MRPASAPRHRKSPRLRSAIGLLSAACLGACIAVPIPQDRVHGRVANADPLTIQAGTTTEEEILLRMGDPDAIFIDERVFVYQWDHVKWGVLWFIGGQGGGTGGVIEVPTHEMVLVQFDSAGLVRRADHAVRPKDVVLGEFLKAWAKGEASAQP